MHLLEQQVLLRKKLLKLYYEAQSGHIGSSLSCIDLLFQLFEEKLDHEKVILSKGHAAGALYLILSEKGEIIPKELVTFAKNATRLPAHPASGIFPNIPFSTGSLGHGLPIACGMVYSNRLKQNSDWVSVLLSDGETNEGTCWEAAHFAVSNQLTRLLVVIDKNQLQAFGATKDILGDTASKEKWESIGFETVEIDGHSLVEIKQAIHLLKNSKLSSPKLIIANTTKGKGVSFMENQLQWHYLPMTEELYKEALSSLENYLDA